MGDQGSNKTGSARDDELKHEMQGELNASRALRPWSLYRPASPYGSRSGVPRDPAAACRPA